jgi:hypothetical protein
MKKIFIIFYVFLVSVFFYSQSTMDICRLHSILASENVMELCGPTEDICQEDVLVKPDENASYKRTKDFLSATLSPLTIPGIRPFIWQPPEV